MPRHQMVAASPSITAVLPDALTAQILHHVPQQQRLQQCALTCKAWASAAVLATTHVDQELPAEGQTIPAFESWLQQHAGHLDSLQLSYSDWCEKHELQLPWAKLAKLQRLQLQGFELALPREGDSSSNSTDSTPTAGAGASSSSLAKGTHIIAPLLLPRLQHLQLFKVQLVSTSSLLQLAAVPGLTSLKIKEVSFAQFDTRESIRNIEATVQQLAAAISGLLQKLPRLAVLELPGVPMSDAAMRQLGCMQGLQEVVLEHADYMPACDLQLLPSSITQFGFSGNLYGIGTGPQLPPQLQHLTRLLQLKLHYCLIQPAVLGSLTRLQTLQLQCCRLPLYGDGGALDTEGTAALLDALSKLTCLQELWLSLEGLDTVSTAPQRFAGLTASTHLTRLVLNPDDKIPLARGAAQYMFPAGRQLPVLQEVTISPTVDLRTDLGTEDEWCLEGPDIYNIAACCTGMQELDIAHSVRPGADLWGLMELPQSLHSLCVGGEAFGDAAVPVLTQLTQLEYIGFHMTPGFTDAGLQQLTVLDLGRLYVYGCGLTDAICEKYDALELTWDSAKGSVREQLEALCDLSTVCAPAQLRKQRKVNKQLRSEVKTLRMQLQRSQAQNQRLQQQLEAAQAANQQG